MAGDDLETELGRNRRVWSEVNASFTDADAAARWAESELCWGLFRLPEREVGVLGEVAGLDVLELGCGTAYVSAALARAGARPVAVDLSAAQLATAHRCQAELGPVFPLVEAAAEDLPLRAACVDLVVSEYGVGAWGDPTRWLPEAARVLRPGGRLVFLTNSVLACLCVPADEGFATDRLQRPQRDLFRVAWPGGGVEYHPGHGDWIRMLRDAGFVVDALHELYPPRGAGTHRHYDIVTAEWAARWPAEDLWVAHRPAPPSVVGRDPSIDTASLR